MGCGTLVLRQCPWPVGLWLAPGAISLYFSSKVHNSLKIVPPEAGWLYSSTRGYAVELIATFQGSASSNSFIWHPVDSGRKLATATSRIRPTLSECTHNLMGEEDGHGRQYARLVFATVVASEA